MIHEEQSEKSKTRSENGVAQILHSCGHGVLSSGMYDQRHRDKGHELEEHVECYKIARVTYTYDGTYGHGVKSQEKGFFSFVGYVFKSKEYHQYPDGCYSAGKEPGHGILMKCYQHGV